MVSRTKGKNRPTVRALTKEDGMPSDFIRVRISNAVRHPGKVLAYEHLMLGWMGPKSSYMVKLVAENAHKIIDKGYEVNKMVLDVLNPGGALLGEVESIDKVIIFGIIFAYAKDRSTRNKTDLEYEIARLMIIFCLPFGVAYLVLEGGMLYSKGLNEVTGAQLLSIALLGPISGLIGAKGIEEIEKKRKGKPSFFDWLWDILSRGVRTGEKKWP